METLKPRDSSLIIRYKAVCAEHPPTTVDLNGHRWTYRAGGTTDSSAVLLLPGALGFSETGFEYIAALAPHLHVIAPEYPETMRTMTELADGVVNLMEVCGIHQAHVVGGSFGGLVAQVLLARHPDRVLRVVLSDTSLPNPYRVCRMQAAAALIRMLPYSFAQRVLDIGVRHYVSALPCPARNFWLEHFDAMRARLTREEIEARAVVWAEFDSTCWPDVPPHEMLVIGAASDRSVSPYNFLIPFPHASVFTVDSPLGHAASIGDPAAYLCPILTFLTRGCT